MVQRFFYFLLVAAPDLVQDIVFRSSGVASVFSNSGSPAVLATLKSTSRRTVREFKKWNPDLLYSSMMMTAATLAALTAVLYAALFEWVTLKVTYFSASHPIWFMTLAPFMMVSSFLLVRFCAPGAAGSGIPRIMASIHESAHPVTSNNPDARSGLKPRSKVSIRSRLRITAVKIASSTLALGAGGAVGREGPTIQICAAIFEAVEKLFGRVIPARSREGLLIAGGSAGLAAAFNTPLGGVVFAIEELSQSHLKKFKSSLILAVVTAGYVAQAIRGPYLFIGHPTIGAMTLSDWRTTALVILSCALAGSLFGRELFRASQRLSKISLNGRVACAAIIGLLVSATVVWIGPHAVGGGADLIKDLLFTTNKDPDAKLVGWRLFGPFVSYLGAGAGGIFAPALAAGAALGAKMASLVNGANVNLAVVIGMISFLTGVTKSPLTSFILIFEMTDRQSAIIPMMFAALCSSGLAHLVEPESFYEKMRNLILERHQKESNPPAS